VFLLQVSFGADRALLTWWVRRYLVLPQTYCNTLQHTAAHCSTLQHIAAHCSTLQHTATIATQCNMGAHLLRRCIASLSTHYITPQHITTHSITPQQPATHCNPLQHTATHSNVGVYLFEALHSLLEPFGGVIVLSPHLCCSVLQIVAVRCSALW